MRFAYEWHDDSGNWYRSYGNENWEFNEHGLMQRRFASINDLPIAEADRKFFWPLGCTARLHDRVSIDRPGRGLVECKRRGNPPKNGRVPAQGRRDTMVAPSSSRSYAAKSRAKYVEVDSGHFAMLFRSAEVEHAIEEFIRTL